MPPLAPLSGSDSDSDAPETVSRATARAQIRNREHAVRSFHTEQKDRAKARNRARDARGKERARTRTEPSFEQMEEDEEQDEESMKLEARMRRAMEDAGQEEDESEEDGYINEGDADRSDEESSENDGEEDEGMEDEVDDEFASSQDEEEAPISEDENVEERSVPRKNPNHLPEHLFAALGRRRSPPPPAVVPKTATKAKPATTSRKPRRKGAKDIVLGSRTIRSLATRPSRPQTLPPARVNKFLTKALALKPTQTNSSGSAARKQQQKTWQRRPAHLGALRPSSEPISSTHFARRS